MSDKNESGKLVVVNSIKVIPFVIQVIVWGLRCVFVKQLPPDWLIIFQQLGKIIDEFSPFFPVAQQVKRLHCFGVAVSYNGDSGGGSSPGLQSKTFNN